MKNFETLLKLVEKHPVRKVAVAVGQDGSVIQAAREARERNIAETVLVGDEGKIRQAAEATSVPLEGIRIIHEADPLQAVAAAVRTVSSGEADILMKGYIHTDDFLRGVLMVNMKRALQLKIGKVHY